MDLGGLWKVDGPALDPLWFKIVGGVSFRGGLEACWAENARKCLGMVSGRKDFPTWQSALFLLAWTPGGGEDTRTPGGAWK